MLTKEEERAMEQSLIMSAPAKPSQEYKDELIRLAQAKEAVNALQSRGVSAEVLQPYIIKMNEQEFRLRNMQDHVPAMDDMQSNKGKRFY